MASSRRKFLSNAFLGGLGAAAFPFSSGANGHAADPDFSDAIPGSMKARYAKLDQIRKQPVFKKEFP
jgi:hypothetical protein